MVLNLQASKPPPSQADLFNATLAHVKTTGR